LPLIFQYAKPSNITPVFLCANNFFGSAMENAMYYIAVLAPEVINAEVIGWKHFMRDRFGCTVALKSPAHITLISPFWMKTDLQPILQQTMNEFGATQTWVDILLTNFGCFEPRVIFVNVENTEPLRLLQGDLERRLLSNKSFIIKRETRRFHPHISIASRDLQKRNFAEAWEHFKNKSYHASFTANGVTLLRHSGIKWEPLHTALFPFK
jgi:2'-5' RNA ligase